MIAKVGFLRQSALRFDLSRRAAKQMLIGHICNLSVLPAFSHTMAFQRVRKAASDFFAMQPYLDSRCLLALVTISPNLLD